MTAAATYAELRPALVRGRVAAGDGSFDWMIEGEELFDAVDLWQGPRSPLEIAGSLDLAMQYFTNPSVFGSSRWSLPVSSDEIAGRVERLLARAAETGDGREVGASLVAFSVAVLFEASARSAFERDHPDLIQEWTHPVDGALLAGVHRGDRSLAARAFGAGAHQYTATAGAFEHHPGRRISTPPAWTLESFRSWVEEVATNPVDSIEQRVAGCGAMLLGALFCQDLEKLSS